MNQLFIANLKKKLEKRIERLNSSDKDTFHINIKQFFKFLTEEDAYKGIIDQLICKFPDTETTSKKLIEKRQGIQIADEKEVAAVGFKIIEHIFNSGDSDFLREIGRIYNSSLDSNGHINLVNKLFLEPLYFYLDECLDSQRFMLALLRRYKHRSEWFHKNELWKLYQKKEKKNRTGEKNLALNMYAFLYDQGVDFIIEPSCIEGKPDLVAAQNPEDPVILDAKIYDGDKSYICKAYYQVYNYTQRFNEPFGYLVIFNTSENDLSIQTGHTTHNFQTITHNFKTIFIIVINIHQYAKPISQRGVLNTIVITEKDMIKTIDDKEK